MAKKKKLSDTIKFAIVGAFSLVIALAWNEAIIKFFDQVIEPLVPIPETSYIYKIFLAVVVTIVASIGIWIVSQRFNNKK